MKYIGLDLGSRTLGVAISDALGMLARAYETFRFLSPDTCFLDQNPRVEPRNLFAEKVTYVVQQLGFHGFFCH